MRVYKCDVCGGIYNSSEIVRIKHWFTKSDVCRKCWVEFKALRKLEKASEK